MSCLELITGACVRDNLQKHGWFKVKHVPKSPPQNEWELTELELWKLSAGFASNLTGQRVSSLQAREGQSCKSVRDCLTVFYFLSMNEHPFTTSWILPDGLFRFRGHHCPIIRKSWLGLLLYEATLNYERLHCFCCRNEGCHVWSLACECQEERPSIHEVRSMDRDHALQQIYIGGGVGVGMVKTPVILAHSPFIVLTYSQAQTLAWTWPFDYSTNYSYTHEWISKILFFRDFFSSFFDLQLTSKREEFEGKHLKLYIWYLSRNNCQRIFIVIHRIKECCVT